jgi:hypothetical protein
MMLALGVPKIASRLRPTAFLMSADAPAFSLPRPSRTPRQPDGRIAILSFGKPIAPDRDWRDALASMDPTTT